jgi:hypothetical protein
VKPELISLAAAAVSAIAALITVYTYRAHGKGFIWTKDPGVKIAYMPDRTLYVEVNIPLVNFGTGNVRFLSLRAKRVHLRNNAVETFSMDMDEAYFPPGVQIVVLKMPVTSPPGAAPAGTQGEFRMVSAKDYQEIQPQEMQSDVNRRLEEIGEVLVIATCTYRDGSWFGMGKRKTTIAMAMRGPNLNYLSTTRRRDLNELFR